MVQPLREGLRRHRGRAGQPLHARFGENQNPLERAATDAGFVKIMNLIIGLTPEKAADNMLKVLGDIAQKHKNGATYAWAKQRPPLNWNTQPGDLERLEALTKEILRQYL